tara:strand:+ start:860 stop:1078 length:219 start_codon:yes stop_codon:yes gene_type:complete
VFNWYRAGELECSLAVDHNVSKGRDPVYLFHAQFDAGGLIMGDWNGDSIIAQTAIKGIKERLFDCGTVAASA